MTPQLSDGTKASFSPQIFAHAPLSGLAAACYEEALRAQHTLASALADAWVQTGALLASATGPDPLAVYPQLAARLSETAWATSFRLAEASALAQERLIRAARTAGLVPALVPAWPARAAALLTVAMDLLSGYAALDGRAHWQAAVTPEERLALHERGAARLLEVIASLGGILIKAGQFASSRPDLFPGPYIAAFATLQDAVPPRPWPAIAAALACAFGRPPEDIFACIDPRPLAAASIAQVHRARLRDGREVAVKVQYPDARDLAVADLAALELLSGVSDTVSPTWRLEPILAYLRHTIPLELDFRQEVAACERLRAALAHRGDVSVPGIIHNLSNDRVLVMDFAEGIKISERTALAEASLDPRAVAHLLNDVYAEQLLRHGILHADPHPGNVLVQPGPRLVLLDHGLSSVISPGLRCALAGMVLALAAGYLEALQRALSLVSGPGGPQPCSACCWACWAPPPSRTAPAWGRLPAWVRRWAICRWSWCWWAGGSACSTASRGCWLPTSTCWPSSRNMPAWRPLTVLC